MKLYSTYLEPLNNFRELDNVIRPSFRNTGTRTGRLSSSNPNLQNLPKAKDTDQFKIREQFIAPQGYKMLACDFSGQELRILALISKEKQMYDALVNGNDLHQMTADKLGTTRDKGKIFNFAIAYGKSSFGFAKDFNISEEEAQEMVDKYEQGYPNILLAKKKCFEKLEATGFVSTVVGRRRHWSKIEAYGKEYYPKKCYRDAFNHLIQGLASDLLRMASNAVYKLGKNNPQWGLKQVATVHDENVYIIKEEYLESALPLIKHAFENGFKSKMPFPVEIGIGGNYHQAK
jgi:DNA polymerase-1